MSKIFGLTKEQIRKQSGKNHDVDPQFNMSPINPGETFEACLRGSQKILNDPELRERMYRVYRGIKRENN